MRGAAQVRSRRAKGGHKHTGGERETTVMDQRRGRGFHLFDRVFGEQRVELSSLSDRLRTCRSWKQGIPEARWLWSRAAGSVFLLRTSNSQGTSGFYNVKARLWGWVVC